MATRCRVCGFYKVKKLIDGITKRVCKCVLKVVS
jgi:hypothetical protein